MTLEYNIFIENPDKTPNYLSRFESKIETGLKLGSARTDLIIGEKNNASTVVEFVTTKKLAELGDRCNCLDGYRTRGRTVLGTSSTPNIVYLNLDGSKPANYNVMIHEMFGHILFGGGHWKDKDKKNSGYMCILNYNCGYVTKSDKLNIYSRAAWKFD